MIITGPITNLYTSLDSGRASVADLGQLRAGQILHAITLSNSKPGFVSLRIGNTELNAATTIPLQQNTQLQLKVVQLQPQLLLQLLPSATQAGSNPLQQALISLLPQQTGLAPLLNNLTTRDTNGSNSSKSTLRSILETFTGAVSSREQVSQASGLRQAVIQSGLFLEARLASGHSHQLANISADLKAVLSRLFHHGGINKTHVTGTSNNTAADIRQQSGNLPPPLRGRLPAIQTPTRMDQAIINADADSALSNTQKNIEGVLARLVLHQVATTENFNSGRALWQLEIPVLSENDMHTVSLTIEKRQQQSKTEDQDAWFINIALELPKLGPIQARISLHNNNISSTFWSESPESVSAINDRLQLLRENLAQQGMGSVKLSCKEGAQPCATSSSMRLPLLDYRA